MHSTATLRKAIWERPIQEARSVPSHRRTVKVRQRPLKTASHGAVWPDFRAGR